MLGLWGRWFREAGCQERSLSQQRSGFRKTQMGVLGKRSPDGRRTARCGRVRFSLEGRGRRVPGSRDACETWPSVTTTEPAGKRGEETAARLLGLRAQAPPVSTQLRPFRPLRPPSPAGGRLRNVSRKARVCRDAALKAPAQTLENRPGGPAFPFSGGGAVR